MILRKAITESNNSSTIVQSAVVTTVFTRVLVDPVYKSTPNI